MKNPTSQPSLIWTLPAPSSGEKSFGKHSPTKLYQTDRAVRSHTSSQKTRESRDCARTISGYICNTNLSKRTVPPKQDITKTFRRLLCFVWQPMLATL